VRKEKLTVDKLVVVVKAPIFGPEKNEDESWRIRINH